MPFLYRIVFSEFSMPINAVVLLHCHIVFVYSSQGFLFGHLAGGAITNVTLVNGGSPDVGRVELLKDGQWGTICDDDFDKDDALVICRMMNKTVDESSVSTIDRAFFGQGQGSIFLPGLGCSGTETSIEDCSYLSYIHCTHSEDVSVVCSLGRIPIRFLDQDNIFPQSMV
ncbi:Galectin-3-binding protein [Mizuhopecten yessoensis]|uniref:Galectin-3-binding protein n=1 Tax=Mizuhopecten yessoensis TaxID=6573 RepID=A0A210QVB5_MIZYE|nr:Galectin-3-binding protein [Mizuhopecten yessoensis]